MTQRSPQQFVNQFMNPYKKYKNPSYKPTETIAIAPPLIDINGPIPRTTENPSQHIKMSIRLPRGIVTSLTLKKNILSLWLLYTADEDELDLENIVEYREANRIEDIGKFTEMANTLISAFVYKCLEDWDKETGKGLSDFVTEKMIEDLLEDYILYSTVIGLLG